MPIFEYRGLTKAGKNVRGSIDAENQRTARIRLKKDGIFIIDLKNKQAKQKKSRSKARGSQKRVGVQDLSMMTRQLATLLRSNVPLVDSLAAVAAQVENAALKEAMSEIRDMVNEGSPLHRSLAKYPRTFNKIFISMCEAGEMSGTLDVILLRLAEFTEAQNELAARVKSAMLYPVVMLIFVFLMLMGLFTYVIPKITVIFEQADMKLPWYSELVIDISGFMVNYWQALLAGAAGSILLFRNWKNTQKGSDQWDSITLRIPIVGKISRMIAVSRFTRTLSTLLTGGVPMLSAMDIVRNVVDNAVLAKAIVEARDNISEGETIAGPLKRSGEFPPIVIHMISIGEKTGELENMLEQLSDSYDFQVKNNVDGLTSILEPLLIVFMGVIIGVIVFAIMIPIFEMSNIGG
jgi:general secretion pathway protein F